MNCDNCGRATMDSEAMTEVPGETYCSRRGCQDDAEKAYERYVGPQAFRHNSSGMRASSVLSICLIWLILLALVVIVV